MLPVPAARGDGGGTGDGGSAGAALAAEQLADEARALAAAGDLLGAAARFRAAHALDPRPELLCNVGVAFHKAKDLPRAHLYLGQCLTRVGSLEAGFASSVRAVFAAVEDTLRGGAYAPVDVTVTPATASVTVSAFDPEDAIVGARVVWLPFGHHTLTARAEGHVEQAVAIDLEGPGQQTARIALVRASGAAGAGADDGTTGGGDSIERPVSGQLLPRSRRPAIVATAATGGLAIGAGVVYLLARSAAASAGDAGIDDREYADRVDSARFRQHLSWGLGGAAAIGAVASGWLWYRATRSPRAPVLTVDVGGGAAGGATAVVRGRF
jgi:hypothetical protein